MTTSIHEQVLLACFVAALLLGAVMNRTRFCTVGAVSDWIGSGDHGRLRAWFLAIAVALIGLVTLEATSLVTMPSDPNEVFPPYRTTSFSPLSYLVGGFLFGVGMTLSSGCSTKALLRVGTGSLKATTVVVVLGLTAYLMLHTDFFGLYLRPLLRPTTIELGEHGIVDQRIGSIAVGLFGSGGLETANHLLGGGVAFALLVFVFRSGELLRDRENLLSGLLVGLIVVAGWYITAGAMGQAWIEEALFAENPPSRVVVQSYTFVGPPGDAVRLASFPSLDLLNFGIVGAIGVILGAFLDALVRRRIRLEWFRDFSDAAAHLIGAVLMGVGGVLSMGCTIPAMSTMALGPFLAIGAIIAGSALTVIARRAALDRGGVRPSGTAKSLLGQTLEQ